jgi:hypothetical protein
MLQASGLRCIGDSGAFSAMSLGKPISVRELTDWSLEHGSSLAWSASLDVIGDQDATWRNYRAMRSAGVDAVPTIHFPSEPTALDRYAEDGVDYVGLGGMVGHRTMPDKLMRWCVQVFRYARDRHPGMRFHGWGMTNQKIFTALPWYSVDSSTPGQVYRYGKVSIFNPDTGKDFTCMANGRSLHEHGDALRKHYGVTPAEVSVSDKTNRHLHVRIGARSLQLREDQCRARRLVTAPTYGLHEGDTEPGPHIHYADTDKQNLKHLFREKPTE